MQGIDARGYLIGWAQGVTSMTIADINAIPDDKWTATFGGCTRPANELTADAISLLIWCAGALKGETAGGEGDAMKELTEACANKAVAVAKLKESCDLFCAALGAASDETLNSTVTPPWQMPTPLYSLCQIAVSHIWYHDGQLNYIHCLLGDNKIYWMGGE
ncbi:MAG TPA: hypothetical protein VHE55_00825 [Fimbriimonadaceae bacterium]|nr:hypothetical protein [Fimbriimonadaceae bacterium]